MLTLYRALERSEQHYCTQKMRAGLFEQNEVEQFQQYLLDLVPELESLADHTQEIAAVFRDSLDHYDCGFLIAALSRTMYAQDCFLRTSLSFPNGLGVVSKIPLLEQQLEEVAYELERIRSYLNAIRVDQHFNSEQITDLSLVVRTLPGTLRANVHDIRLLCHVDLEELGFEEFGFLAEEAREWVQLQVTPVQAGYWRAYGFHPGSALDWFRYDVFLPLVASEWETVSFTAAEAAPWIALGVSPLAASAWQAAAFGPEQAEQLIRQGYATPEMLPPGKMAGSALFGEEDVS